MSKMCQLPAWSRRAAWVFTIAVALGTGTVKGVTAQADGTTGPLAQLAALIGTWTAEGTGFSTILTYRWLLDGTVLEAANEVRGADGRVLARYRGMYAWDAGRGEIVFWTAAGSGEVHRGRAWWRDGLLWHEADVSGGTIVSYASVVRPADGRIEYFADYAADGAHESLLRTEPLVYSRTIDEKPGGSAVTSDPVATDTSWFSDEIDYLTRDGGRWIADNSAYRSPDEPFATYGLSWTRGVSGHTAIGRLFAVDDDGVEHNVWELHLYWDPTVNQAIAMQLSLDGTFGSGRLELTRERSELIQQFRRPDSSTFELRHVEIRSPDQKDSRSFVRADGEWQPERAYTWKRDYG